MIPPTDLRVTVKTRQGGGQQVGTVDTTVIVEHLPTGLTASCGVHRSQLKNRDTAIEMIEWGLTTLQ